jgi:hypothetical protein
VARLLTSALIAAAALGLLALAGCGSSSSSTAGGQGESTAATKPSPTAPGGKAESEAPKGASPVLRQIYRQFPKPAPNPTVKGSAAAIAAGERACKGKTPLEVKEAFYAAAKANLQPEQTKMIAELASFEKNAATDSSFVAGQLAAGVYQATLPEAVAQFGYQGCIYALALELKRELGPGG